MVLMYAPKDRAPSELLRQGLQDGRRYEAILQEMREVRDVADGNREYVLKLLITTENEVLGLVRKYSDYKTFKEYFNEERRIMGMVREKKAKELELKKMELEYIASSNNE